VQILLADRSGEEGNYPDLEACAEKQLASLDPEKYACLQYLNIPFLLSGGSYF